MSNWQQQWQESFKKIDDLLSHLNLSREAVAALDQDSSFPLRVPRAFADRIEKGNPSDPLLKQILPLSQELDAVVGFIKDPLAENDSNPLPGLLHKYTSRVLLTLSGACAVHCRYCFRRHFPYNENNPGTKGWEPVFEYLMNHPEVKEVILSGGDPLSVDDSLLENFMQRLENISSIKYLRIHTRLPVVIPARVTENLLKILKTSRFRITMVLHSNHANEWDASLELPMQQLKEAGVTLLNQAVLLKDVNDSLSAQVELSYRLYDIGILPYYLHLLDKVSGAAHFDIDKPIAVQLMRDMIATLPGYLVPKLVYEAPHRKSKTPVDLGMEKDDNAKNE
ncbi:MAG: EF-P beta-lysylation protein EpmB [Pseudomonadota bacterium]